MSTEASAPQAGDLLSRELAVLALMISDEASRFDIEFACVAVVLNNGEWIDTKKPSPDVDELSDDDRDATFQRLVRALRYLDLRRQLEYHPLFPTLIRFSQPKAPH